MSDGNYVPPPEDSSEGFLVKLVTFMGEVIIFIDLKIGHVYHIRSFYPNVKF